MIRKKNLELADDQMCFGCGSKNDRGLKLQFELDAETRRLKTGWIPPKEFQGYRDIVHGGVLGLVLDEMMVNLLWTLKMPAVTAELKLRLSRPAAVGEPLDFEAWIVSEEGRIIRTEGTAKKKTGELVARATARCIKGRLPFASPPSARGLKPRADTPCGGCKKPAAPDPRAEPGASSAVKVEGDEK